MSNQIFNPRELAEMARFYEEVRQARLTQAAHPLRAPAEPPLPPDIRALRGLPASSKGASIQITAGETRRSILQVRSKGEEAEIMCITVGAMPINVSFQPALFPPYSASSFGPINSAVLIGRLTWGVGQATFEAFFDLNRGMIISVPANFVSLAVDYTDFGVGGQPTFQVSASVAYGVQPQQRSSAARFTQFLGTLAKKGDPGSSIIAPIPPWAIAFTPMSSISPTLGPPNLEFFVQDSGVAFAGMTYEYTSATNSADQKENQFPIWNGAEIITVTNNDPVNSNAVNIVYTLAI